MDKIEKVLAKLTAKGREQVRRMLLCLQRRKTAGFDVKKLKGRDDIFRIRKGSVRIVYRRTKEGEIFVLLIERRNEHTYDF